VKELEDRISVPSTEANCREIERLTEERNAAKANAEDYSQIIGRQDLLDRKATIEKSISDVKGSVSEDRAEISKEIAAIEPKLAEAKEKYGRFERRISGESAYRN